MELREYKKSLFRKFYHFFIILIMLIGIVKLFSNDYYLAVIWVIVTPILLFIPRNIYKIKFIKKNYNANVLFLMELFSLIFLIDAILGTLFLYPLGIDYDSFVHFINLFLVTILVALVYTFITHKYNIKINNKKVATFSFIYTFAFGILLWEPFQKLNDILFGTHLFHDFVQDIRLDVLLDITFGTMGVLFGSYLIYKHWNAWLKKWEK